MRSQVFDDFDAFAESVPAVDSKMLLRNPQNRVWSINSVALGQIDVQVGKLGSGNIAQGEVHSDRVIVYLPLSDRIEYAANGVVLPKLSCAVLEPGSEFCISTKVEHDWCAAFIPTKLIDREAELALQESRSCHVVCPPASTLAEVREVLQQIMQAAATCPGFESSAASRLASDTLLELTNSIVDRRHRREPAKVGRSKISRNEIVQSSMDLLDQRAGHSVAVRDLAAAAAVSERTLRTAFQDYFGVGPARYLQLRHLHRVHRALKAANPEETTVSQILVEHGEYAFSRFASRYRRLFGQFPVETLRSSQM